MLPSLLFIKHIFLIKIQKFDLYECFSLKAQTNSWMQTHLKVRCLTFLHNAIDIWMTTPLISHCPNQ